MARWLHILIASKLNGEVIMRNDKNASISPWMKTASVPSGKKLKEDIHTDVCIVGAGISGLTTAYLLAREGKKVVVLESGSIGSGESGRTTAHLSNAIDSRYFEIERLHGKEGAKLAAKSHTAAIDRIESIVQDEKIDCDFQRIDGFLFAPIGHPTTILDAELKAAHRAGLASVTRCKSLPLPSLSDTHCLKFPRQGQLHPMKYLAGLANAFIKYGGSLYSQTRVVDIQGGVPAIVETAGGHTVTADSVVVATNTPFNDRFVIHTKQVAYRTYAISFPIPKDSVPNALYWDTLDPYHYIRIQTEGDSQYLIVGGEDHRTGESRDEFERYLHLEGWANAHFANLGEPTSLWSGQVEESIDGLAYIGRNPADAPNIFVATGDSGMGMTHGTIAGELLGDLINGRENPWAKLYDPSRKTVAALVEWVKGNANTALQYSDYLTPGEVSSTSEIPRGEGAILRKGYEKLAVYRSTTGKIKALSAVCPHLGGIVHWNTAEKSWDCPCHGSRFSVQGKILQGPAVTELTSVLLDEAEKRGATPRPPHRIDTHATDLAQ